MTLTHVANIYLVAEPVLCCAGPVLEATIANIRKNI